MVPVTQETSSRYQPDDLDHLGYWAALARSCGWWWAGEDVCIVVDRPEAARTEPLPGAWHEEIRLQRTGLRYRDGWHADELTRSRAGAGHLLAPACPS